MPRSPLLLLAVVLAQAASEPPPRTLAPVRLEAKGLPPYISAVHELADGRLLVTNARGPALLLVEPSKGVTPIGQAGAGADRYARPGGLYAGRNGTVQMIDRALTRAFTIGPGGEIQGSRSIARKGVTSSSDDADMQRLDAAGFVYLVERKGRPQDMTGGPSVAESAILRLDAETQKIDTVATIRGPEQRVIPGGDGMILTRAVIGSPADGWAVAADGRIAVVRAAPYRVEWHTPDGKVISGPVVTHAELPMTEADKDHFRRTLGRGTASVGLAGGAKTDAPGANLLFAATRAPFAPGDVWVSPEGQVWVRRAAPSDAAAATFDIFDERGRRVDRVSVPAGGDVVGFGRQTVYLRYAGADGRSELRKYGAQR